MAWVVDTCLLIDVLDDDPQFGTASSKILDRHAEEGLVISPVTYAELAPSFGGDRELQDEFLGGVGVEYREGWTWTDTLQAHAAWHEHVRKKRAGQAQKRPFADILIGSFALRFQGLLTRNPADFLATFSGLAIRLPDSPEVEPNSF